jgi:aryl-alcohol dehydrogenase-like predicted oxidoreductase
VVLATKVYRQWAIWDRRTTTAASRPTRYASTSRTPCGDFRTDRIDVYQVHHIDERVSAEEFWGTYERIVADGDVLYAGSSNYSGWGLAKRQMQAWQRGFVGFVSEQTQYNLLSRVPEMEVLPRRRTSVLA